MKRTPFASGNQRRITETRFTQMRPIETVILTPSGLRETDYSAESLADAASYEPEGVYTVTRTFNGSQALLLDAHLDRLEESAQLEDIPIAFDRAALRAALRTVIRRSGNPESRFRITIPRENPAWVYVALEPLQSVPKAQRQNGVKVATIDAHRHNPIAKTTAWMDQRKTATAALASDIYEAILVDESGVLLEGTGSNFYAILNRELRTANEGILKGISRRALLLCVGDLLPVRLEGVTLADIPTLSEAFLTSSSRGVVPIVGIDGQPIGDGRPGDFTRKLARCYDDWTAAHLEPI